MHRLTTLAGLIVLSAAPVLAATTPTTMVPFKVEAEFGVDGLRIQPSNSVLNQYQLEQHGVAQLQDISGLAPNLYTSNSDSRGFGDILVLRGMANSIFFGAPSVGLYIDDVPSGSVSSYPSSLLTIDTLAVKAGPQSTDYGRNAPAGLIDIKTRAPGAQHQGRFLVDRGSYDSNTVQVEADGPINEQFGYAATFGFNERDGYIRNTFRNRPADDRESFAGRGAL
jgi:iron complex outermembrane recepter protein